MPQESEDNKDMLPDNIVQELAAQEKYVTFFKLPSILDFMCMHTHSWCSFEHFPSLFFAGKFFCQTLRKRMLRKDIPQERKNQKALGKDS